VKSIFYIGYVPLTNKIKEDLYIDQLLSQNYEVHYVDLFYLFFRKIRIDEAENESLVIKISSYRELKFLLDTINIAEALFISTITFEYHSLYLFRILTNYNVKLAFFARGMIPIASMETPLFYRLIRNPLYFIRNQKLLVFGKNKISLLFKCFRLVKPYDFIFMAGTYGFFTIGQGKRIGIRKSQIININYFDYDKYLELRNNEEVLVNDPYCVFIDQNLPYHPDIKMFFKEEISPKRYYKLLNCFFDDIERRLGIKVVIAAHPKSEYQVNPFGNRLLIKSKTSELVKNAELVFIHNSTSVSFAILFNRPICVLWASVLKNIFLKESLKLFADRIGGLVVDLDEFSIDNFKIPLINRKKYKQYKYDFLTSPDSQNDKTINIFLKALENI
jgi:hypothetical protein